MTYENFTLDQLEQDFGLKNHTQNLFDNIHPISPSSMLQQALKIAEELPIRSEKAKSESIVFPILIELRNINKKFFTIYSGDSLNVDTEKGLKGECDFILAKCTVFQHQLSDYPNCGSQEK